MPAGRCQATLRGGGWKGEPWSCGWVRTSRGEAEMRPQGQRGPKHTATARGGRPRPARRAAGLGRGAASLRGEDNHAGPAANAAP